MTSDKIHHFFTKAYDKTIHIILGIGIGICLTIYVLPSKTFPSLDERLVLTDEANN